MSNNKFKLTAYKCVKNMGTWSAQKSVWVYNGQCSENLKTVHSRTKDKRCCGETKKRGLSSCLYVRYDGDHTCNTKLGDSSNNNKVTTIKGVTLEERAKEMFDSLKVVNEVPEVFGENDVFLLNYKVLNEIIGQRHKSKGRI